MQVIKSFLLNLSVMVTCAYLFNLGFKYFFENASLKVRHTALIVIFIIAGWLSMVFGLRGENYTLFDLRAVPIIFGTLLFQNPRHLLIIGLGIALSRLTFDGITPQAMTGFLNILVLGCLGSLLVLFYRRRTFNYIQQAFISVVTIVTFQVVCIAAFGAVPTHYYLNEVAPYSYPAGLLVSLFFVFIISDFYKEQRRADEHRNMNLILRSQTRDLRQTKLALEEKANELLSASKYKSEFIANMSHELRTPLNSIILLSQFIRDNEEDIDQNQVIRYADMIHKSGNELLKIINDILDLSKVEAGKMDISFELIAIEDLMQLMRYELEPMAKEKGLVIEAFLTPDVPASMTTDVFRLRQILRNLLMNAIKFTEQGRVGLIVEKPKADNIIFTVYDTGIGISADQQKLIFEAFHQEDGAFTRRFGGTGLGLSISLQLAKLLGGTITVESTKGEGSRFSLHLPLQAENA